MRLSTPDEDTPTLSLLEHYRRIRATTAALTTPLEIEDQVVQSMPDASPTKWHLAHTTWFFETFVLEAFAEGYTPHEPAYRYLFNSYYNGVGEQFARDERGRLSRPTVREIAAYRSRVDEAVDEVIQRRSDDPELQRVLTVGLNHEQQHQELLVTDIKHVLARNPVDPKYCEPPEVEAGRASAARRFEHVEGGRVSVGHLGTGFGFDNEFPRHEVLLSPYCIGQGLVTEGDWLEFIEDGGYSRPELWLSDGWDAIRNCGWKAPLYWSNDSGSWSLMTLYGRRSPHPAIPVAHVSYYEADAFARWAGARLPTEAEWEHAATQLSTAEPGVHLDDGVFHPAGRPAEGPRHFLGEVWSWTASAYLAYPGYRPLEGTLGEYNGKFMSGQMVLRGSSCATARDHARLSYRNFFGPAKRWQFSGLRLAKEAE